MPHYQMLMTSPTGEYWAYTEAESPEAAKAAVEEPGRYEAQSVEERERRLGWTLIMGGNGMYGKFGMGADLAAAKAEFRKAGGKMSLGYTVLTFDSETDLCGVDQMGRFCTVRKDYDWTKGTARPAEREVKPKARR